MKLKIFIALIFIKDILLFKSFVYEKKEKKFCIIENYLNKNFQSFLPLKKTVLISIYQMNIFVLLNIILKQKTLFLKNFQRDYYVEAIKYFNCKVIFSMIDNNKSILEIKNYLPQIKIILVQHGTRFEKQKSYKSNLKFKVDYYLTFNKYYSDILSRNIKSTFLEIGFIENNKFKIKKKINKKKILYISDFNKDHFKNENISWYESEKKILPIIENYCAKNNYELFIYPRTSLDLEKKFYFNILKKMKFKYLDRNLVNTFDEVDNSMLVVFMNSTLGYEALSRGKIAASFGGRARIDKSRSFGWPKYNFDNEGFFWTNNPNKKKVLKILNRLTKMNKKIWTLKSKKYLSDLCLYDYKNKKVKKLISKQLALYN